MGYNWSFDNFFWFWNLSNLETIKFVDFLKHHRTNMGANCLIFSTIETLQTRKTYINSGKSWLVQVNLTQSFPSPYFSFLWIYPMDYLHEFYSIYTIIITYDIRKTVLLTCINYVCNQYCCSKKDTGVLAQ